MTGSPGPVRHDRTGPEYQPALRDRRPQGKDDIQLQFLQGMKGGGQAVKPPAESTGSPQPRTLEPRHPHKRKKAARTTTSDPGLIKRTAADQSDVSTKVWPTSTP